MRIRAILFDLHETLTLFNEHPRDIFRRVSDNCGINLSQMTNSERDDAFLRASEWLNSFQIENEVDMHYGSQPEHWIEFYRIVLEQLGGSDIDETILMNLEKQYKNELLGLENFTEAASQTVRLLHDRGYPVGIVTRRYDDPR